MVYLDAVVSQPPPPPSSEYPPNDAANWSAGEPEEPERRQTASPPAERTWDPGPAPGYETPGFQPLTQTPAAAYPPPIGLQVVPAPPTNGMAIASLVCGLAGIFVLPVIAPLLAVIFGHMARGQIRNSGEGGGGMAVAGLVLGYISLAFALIGLLIVIVIVIVAAAAASASGASGG